MQSRVGTAGARPARVAPVTRALCTALLAAALLAAGCGDGKVAGAGQPTVATTTPALARAPKAAGEVVVRGDTSPGSHGPYQLSGTYVARFQQYAPEDPELDFSGQTPFVARLDPHAATDEDRSTPLFAAAASTGTKTIRARGRLYIDVEFGDFPYVIRLTPKA
jgi:hypothetical protein